MGLQIVNPQAGTSGGSTDPAVLAAIAAAQATADSALADAASAVAQSGAALTSADLAQVAATAANGNASAALAIANAITARLVANGVSVTGKVTLGDEEPTGQATGDIWLDTFCFETDFSGGWPATTARTVTNPTNTFTLSTVQKSSPDRISGARTVSSAAPVGKIAHASGTEASDRRIYTFDSIPLLKDVDFKALLWGRSAPQQGLAVRLINIGNTTTQNAYTTWNDKTLNIPDLWNLGNWKGTAGNFTHTDNGHYVDAVQKKFQVYGGDVTGGVATLNISGHDIQVGDKLEAITSVGSPYDPNQATVTAVTPISVSWASATANRSDPNMTGWAGTHRTIFPHWVRLRVVGNTVWGKVWRQPDAEPSWNDPAAAYTWTDSAFVGPQSAGAVGLINAHQLAGQYAEWGYISVTRAPSGPKVWNGTTWRSTNPAGR